MYIIVGSCPHCGAPIYQYAGAWGAVVPPPVTYSCMCNRTNGQVAVVTTTTTNTEVSKP